MVARKVEVLDVRETVFEGNELPCVVAQVELVMGHIEEDQVLQFRDQFEGLELIVRQVEFSEQVEVSDGRRDCFEALEA